MYVDFMGVSVWSVVAEKRRLKGERGMCGCGYWTYGSRGDVGFWEGVRLTRGRDGEGGAEDWIMFR